MRLDGKARDWQKRSITIPANGMIEVARPPIPSPSERNPREWLYAATLTGKGIANDQTIWLLAPHRELALAEAGALDDGSKWNSGSEQPRLLPRGTPRR